MRFLIAGLCLLLSRGCAAPGRNPRPISGGMPSWWEYLPDGHRQRSHHVGAKKRSGRHHRSARGDFPTLADPCRSDRQQRPDPQVADRGRRAGGPPRGGPHRLGQGRRVVYRRRDADRRPDRDPVRFDLLDHRVPQGEGAQGAAAPGDGFGARDVLGGTVPSAGIDRLPGRVGSRGPGALECLGGILFLAVFGSIIGFTAFAFTRHTLPSHVVGTYAYVNPLVAVIFGRVFFGEALSGRTLLGGALVLTAVFVTTIRSSAPPAEACQAKEPARG